MRAAFKQRAVEAEDAKDKALKSNLTNYTDKAKEGFLTKGDGTYGGKTGG